jgi:glycosyltransferase involved in cell wall biosynthesis
MLSVIIATRESERELVRTLAVLVSGAAAGLVREVIVADAGSRDATADVADSAGCHVLVGSGPAGARLKAAAATARAAWLMFLRPGTVMDMTWIDDATRFIEDEDGSRAAVFRPTPNTIQPVLLEILALLRGAWRLRPDPEQGLLIAKSLYDRLGGHRDNPEAEHDLLRRLGRHRIATLRSGATGPGG